VIHVTDDSFRLNAGSYKVLVDLDGELGRRGVRPFILVYFWAGFVEVIDEIMLTMSALCWHTTLLPIGTYPDLSILLDVHYKPIVISSQAIPVILQNSLTFNDIRTMDFPGLEMSTEHYDGFGLWRQTRNFFANRPQVILYDEVVRSFIEQQVDACVANEICG